MSDKNQKNDKANKASEPGPAEPGSAAKEEKVALAKAEYDALKAKADERDAYYDKYIRAHAEFENVKKRLEKEKADFAKYVTESFIADFLPIVDNLEIAEKHIKEAKDFKAVQEGIDMIQVQIQQFLKDIGLERVKTVNEKFDPHLHEAIETDEAADREEGTIVGELKPGYRLNGRLIRPASVRIVKKKEKDK